MEEPEIGSSPRGRGTHGNQRRGVRGNRFIPARAGNTASGRRRRGAATVHPRAGGEHSRVHPSSEQVAGSSPRGRGTPRRDVGHLGRERFIPARAGNTRAARVALRRQTVHPRAGGEHSVGVKNLRIHTGSSPRGRGTPMAIDARRVVLRFIPARAGNTRSPGLSTCNIPVHPRAGGEHSSAAVTAAMHAGSSPRGRGTRVLGVLSNETLRFIPARAGNTPTWTGLRSTSAVHPRAGGEHLGGVGLGNTLIGSSPRGRGTQSVLPARAGNTRRRLSNVFRRFIPARAGNTKILRAIRDGSSPRGRGTPFHPKPSNHYNGSSPRGRGTLFSQPTDSADLFRCQRTYHFGRRRISRSI